MPSDLLSSAASPREDSSFASLSAAAPRPSRGAGASSPSALTSARSSACCSVGHVQPEPVERDPDRVDAALLAEHDPSLGADELRGVRLDRRRVVELRRDRARLAGEERLAGHRLPRRQRVSRHARRRGARARAPASGRAASGCRRAPRARVRPRRGRRSRRARPCRSRFPAPTSRPPARRRSPPLSRARSRRARASAPGRRPARARGRRGALRPPGVAMPRVSTTTISAAPGLDGRGVDAVEELEVGARGVDAEERDVDPVLGGERDGAPDPVEHRLARDAERVELAVGDRALDHGRAYADLDERRRRRPARRARSPRPRRADRRRRSSRPRGSRRRRRAGSPPRSGRYPPRRVPSRSRASRRA